MLSADYLKFYSLKQIINMLIKLFCI